MRAIVGASASHDDCSFVAELSWVYMTIAHSLPSFRGFQSLEFAGRVVGGKISTIPGMYVLYLAAVEISLSRLDLWGTSPLACGPTLLYYYSHNSCSNNFLSGTIAGPDYTDE